MLINCTFPEKLRHLLHTLCRWLSLGKVPLFQQTDAFFLQRYVLLEHFVATLSLLRPIRSALNSKQFEHIISLGVDPWISFEEFHCPSQIYARLPLDRDQPSWWYIGSTIHSPLQREQSRIRKYSQLERGLDAFYEPALRIWHARQNFYRYFVAPLRHITDQRELRAYELELIKNFKPKLNHPHCNPILKQLRIHVQQYSLPSSTTGLIGNTVIQKYYDPNLPNDQCNLTVLWTRPADLYNLLYRLGSNTKDKFEVAKLLRSNMTSLALLYLMYRYCGQLDEPHRTQATTLVNKAIEFRGGHKPPTNIPMQLYSLSIDHHETHRSWLRQFLHEHSALFPWFHVPTTSVIHIKNPTWKTKVHNFHRFLREWDPDYEPPCQCGGPGFFEERHIRSSGHLFAPLLEVFPHATLSQLNLQGCTWPSSTQWMEQGQKSFYQWQQRWRLPNQFQDKWNLHLHLLWQEHERNLERNTDDHTNRFKRITQEIRMLKRYVLCPGVHHPHQTFIACPCHYHHLLKKTYFEADVFEQCIVGPLTLRDRLCEAAKQDLPRVAQSLINPEGTLPYAYILPKPSKGFEKARPIISYMLSWNAKLGQVIGTIVYELCRSIFGDLQLDRTVQTIITEIQHQFEQIPADVELNLQQQDLSGFFNSVPHSRMIDAVNFAVNHYSYEHGISLESTLSTSIAQEDRTQRIFRGRFRQAGRRYMNIKLSEIPTMVTFLLKNSYLTIGNHVFRQIQGASMGSQFAPALCGLVAAFQEYCFFKAFQGMKTFNRLLHNSRYVDNRVMMHFPDWRHHQPWDVFTRLDFYNPPILLEEVDDSEILGCHISTQQRSITIRQPLDLVTLRSGHSQDSDTAILSAFRARSLLIIRYTYPTTLIIPQIEDLLAIFERVHIRRRTLKPTLRTLTKFLKHRFLPDWQQYRRVRKDLLQLF